MPRLLPPMAGLAVAFFYASVFPADNAGVTDVPVYFDYAQKIAAGGTPYADFPVEYPPLAMGLFWLAGLVGGTDDFGNYARGLVAVLLPFGWAMQVAAARLSPARAAVPVAWSFVALPVVFGTLITERFDVAPAGLAVLALWALAADRPRIAFAVLGLGGALKLFPLVLGPVAVAWLVGRGRTREAIVGTGIAALVVAACSLPFVIASPSGFADQFEFHLDRPVQIESTPASVLFALQRSSVTGAPGVGDEFKSNGLVDGPADLVAALFAFLQLATLTAVALLTWRAARRGDPDRAALVLGGAGAMLAFVALGKVLSPQYLIWLAPFAVVLLARRAWLVAGAMLGATYLTHVFFPRNYNDLVARQDLEIVTIALRNLLLCVALALLAWSLVRLGRAHAGAPASAPPGDDVRVHAVEVVGVGGERAHER